MDHYQGQTKPGTIVNFWIGGHTQYEPQVAIVKQSLPGGAVVLSVFAKDSGAVTHQNGVGHVSHPQNKDVNGNVSARAKNMGVWDFMEPWTPEDKKPTTAKGK